jgi:hypothetical protein
MSEPVEIYRGFPITQGWPSAYPGVKPAIIQDYHVARIDEWLILGTLNSVRSQIDTRLGNKRESHSGD